MREWEPFRPLFLSELIAREAPPEPRTCGRCALPGDWRCNDCFRSPVLCTGCLSSSHTLLPFHRVARWTEEHQHYQASTLAFAGVKVLLEHEGECRWGTLAADRVAALQPAVISLPGDPGEFPSSRAQEGHLPAGRLIEQDLCVVDTSGVHQVRFCPCLCDEAPEVAIQLLRAGLYPASVKRPQSAFTFQVLDDFLLENKECKTAAMAYFSKLRRTTNPVFPDQVPVSVSRSPGHRVTGLTGLTGHR